MNGALLNRSPQNRYTFTVYPAKHFLLSVALDARQNRELLYITHRLGAAHLRLFSL
jgi:hypothetical protein